jgi:hypothetical protein
MKFELPDAVRCVAEARNTLRQLYGSSGLVFTPDGKFVGDLGEAIAAEWFGIRLAQRADIDGFSPCGKPVQIKTTGRVKGGVLFRQSDFADAHLTHLLVFYIDWDECTAEVIYNGPENPVRAKIRNHQGQREVSRSALIKLNSGLQDASRLQMIVNPRAAN